MGVPESVDAALSSALDRALGGAFAVSSDDGGEDGEDAACFDGEAVGARDDREDVCPDGPPPGLAGGGFACAATTTNVTSVSRVSSGFFGGAFGGGGGAVSEGRTTPPLPRAGSSGGLRALFRIGSSGYDTRRGGFVLCVCVVDP